MPSSLIFAGLVVLWLLILVPAVARHQQVVARPSVAALSGRVLARPARPTEEDDVQDAHHDTDERPRLGSSTRAAGPRAEDPSKPGPPAEPDDEDDDGPASEDHVPDPDDDEDDDWERPAPRYRPGRGGFDPEAAALTARARYAMRQRIVLGLLVAAALTAVLALVVSPTIWWVHALVDLSLVGYLVHLRRQVRMEEAIRARRAARMAGTRRPSAAEDPALDEWARRGRDVVRPARDPDPGHDPVYDGTYDDAHDRAHDRAHDGTYDGARDADDPGYDADEPDDAGELPETLDPDPDRVRGCGEPAGPLRDRPGREEEPALPRLAPAPPPPPPAGTTLVEADLDLQELDVPVRSDRRAAG